MFDKFAEQPLPIPQIWLESLRLYKQTVSKVWYLFFVAFLLILVYQLFTVYKMFGGINLLQLATQQQLPSTVNPLYSLIYFLVIFFIQNFVNALVLHRMYYLVGNTDFSLQASIKYISTKFPLILLTVITISLIVGIIFVLFALLPISVLKQHSEIFLGCSLTIAIIFLVWVSFCIPLILFKNFGWFSSITNSIRLVKDHWGRTFLVLLATFILILFIYTGVALIMGAIMLLLNKLNIVNIGMILTTLAALMIQALLVPYLGAVYLVQFNDLQLRKSK